VETARFGPLQGEFDAGCRDVERSAATKWKHEARLFKYLMVIAGAPLEMIRDSSLRSE